MKIAIEIQKLLDQINERNNTHVLVSFDEQCELVYAWLGDNVPFRSNFKDINIEAIDFSYTFGADEVRPLNLYTHVLFCNGHVPPYWNWIYFDAYYDESLNKTYYYSYSSKEYKWCSGLMKGSQNDYKFAKKSIE
jgi:hypothetical protein